jgi:hypothetical protein
LGIKLTLAGHTVKLVCLAEEAKIINEEGAIVRLPVRGMPEPIELDSRDMSGTLSADVPSAVNPADYDLIVLAMQEPQYRAPEVHELLNAVAAAAVPVMSIMNMPPMPYLRRIPGLDVDALKGSYTDSSVWDNLDPALMTLASPDPQAFRPSTDQINLLQVGLPTNFKVARFESDAHTAILKQLEADIDAIRFDTGDGEVELPVKLRVHDSVFVPLAKWSMLLAGNYRCVLKDGMQSIKDSVHADIEESRSVYSWVFDLSVSLGANPDDLVPFEKYANATLSLVNPSSAARALANGATNIERLDQLVQSIAAGQNRQSDAVDRTVSVVDARLDANRLKVA